MFPIYCPREREREREREVEVVLVNNLVTALAMAQGQCLSNLIKSKSLKSCYIVNRLFMLYVIRT